MEHRPLARPPAGSWAHTAHVCGPRGGVPRAGLRQQFCTVRLAYQAFPLAAAHATESAAFTCVVHGGDRQTSGGCAGQTPTGPGARRRSLQTGPSSVLCFASRPSGTWPSHQPALLAQARAAAALLGIGMHRYRKLRWPLIGLLIARFCMVLS